MPEQDQIISATMAQSIQRDAARKHPLLAWVVTQDRDAYDLERKTGHPLVDPPAVVEVWFVPQGSGHLH